MGIAGASQILTQQHIAAQSAQEKIVQEFVDFHGKGISKTFAKKKSGVSAAGLSWGTLLLKLDFETIPLCFKSFRGVFSSIHVCM